MAQILEVSQAEWQTVPGPTDVVVVPQVTNPLEPGPKVTQLTEYLQSDCTTGTCRMLVHNAATGYWRTVLIRDCQNRVSFNIPVGCSPFPGAPNPCQQFTAHEEFQLVAANGGFDPVLQLQIYDPTRENLDFWTLACESTVIEISCDPTVAPCVPGTALFCSGPPCDDGYAQNNPEFPNCCFPIPLVPPAPDWCKPPGVVVAISTIGGAGSGQICQYDPPMPNPLPDYIKPLRLAPAGVSVRETRIRAREGREIAEAQEEFSRAFLALDPTRRGGIPLYGSGNPFKCACDTEVIDEIIGA
jgi:hypothetical protein